MKKEKFNVVGMTCSACSAAVEKAVGHMDGVSSVNVNLLANHMTVEFDDTVVEASSIISAVTDAGYSASLAGAESQVANADKNHVQDEIDEMKQRTIVSMVFMILLMYVAMGHMVGLPVPSFLLGVENATTMALTQFLLTLPVVYINRKYYQTGFKTL